MNPRRLLLHSSPLSILILTAALSSAPPIAAQEADDSRWGVRLYGLGIYPSGDEVHNEIEAGSATFGVNNGSGFGLDLEYMLTRSVGIEAAYMVGDYEADFRLDAPTGTLTDTEDIATEIISLGANYHFTPDHRTDVFAGALVAMSTFEGVIFLSEDGLREKRPFDDDVGFGIKAGIEIPLGSARRWNLNAQIRYLVVIMEAESASGGRDLDLDPFIPSIGIGYRF